MMLSRTNWHFAQSWLVTTRQQHTQPQCIRHHCRQLQMHLQGVQQQTPVKQPIRKLCTSLISNKVGTQPAKSRLGGPKSSILINELRSQLRQSDSQFLPSAGFRTSASRRAIAPFLIFLFVKPIAKLTAIFSGRAFRNWWKTLPHNKRQYFYQYLRSHRYKIIGVGLGLVGICSAYYYSHLQITPFTNRSRFIAFTDNQFKKIAVAEYENMMSLHQEKCLHSSHPLYLTIGKLVIKLIEANNDVPEICDRTWTVHIIDKDITNAFVLPNGEIFVFTGMLKAVTNEDQLATILAHEIAHVVLNHAAELVSFSQLVDVLLIVVLAALWAFLPSDGLAVVATWFKGKVVQLLLEMPYSRSLETEADEVGLILAAKSCMDVRECKAFWEFMALQSSMDEADVNLQWLSTHPSHQNRADYMGAWMPELLELRKHCKCPPLPSLDPSEAVKKQRQILAEERERRKNQPLTMPGIQITS